MSAKANVMRSAPVSLLRGLLVSVIGSALLILLFAIIVLLMDLGASVITPVNQVIKVLSILAGTFVACQGGIKGWIAGLCIGGAYMLLGIILYCAFAGEILPPLVMAGDLGLGLISGFLSGLLAASMKSH